MRVKLLIVFIIAAAFFFPHAGQLLVAQDPFSHADMAVVLSGEPTSRVLAARDLYRKGMIDRILVIPEPPSPAAPELIRLGLLDPKLPSWPEQILSASGVPSSRVHLLQEPVDSTIDEAMAVRRYLRKAKEPPRDIVIVTSKISTRRARFIFRQVLGKANIRVLVYPAAYDPFVPERWWARPKDALRVVEGYLKFSANLFMLPVRLMEKEPAS